MSEGNNLPSPAVWLPNLSILLLIATGLMSEKLPLISLRPTVEPANFVVSENPSRLWEDPFTIKLPAGMGKPTGNEGASANPPCAVTGAVLSQPVLRQLFLKAAKDKADAWRERDSAKPVPDARVLVLPILLSGGPYPEDSENRLRIRYAVLSALGRAQYVPVSPDRMKFVQVPLHPGCTEPEIVRLEDFDVRYLVSDNVQMPGNENYWAAPPPNDPDSTDRARTIEITNAYDHVVVLWLDESRLRLSHRCDETSSARVAQHVSDLLFQLIYAGDEAGEPCCPCAGTAKPADPATATPPPHVLKECGLIVKWDIKIIGPNSSDELLHFMERDDHFIPAISDVEILSARATAADAVLEISKTHAMEFAGQLPDRMEGKDGKDFGWKITRTIPTDHELVKTLLEELDRRKATPTIDRPLVLIGEWDTLYSRGLGRTFAAELNSRETGVPLTSRVAWSLTPGSLREFSYLRGVDGHVPGEKSDESGPATDGETGKPGEAAGKSFLPRNPDHVVGKSQFDYLRRMEERMTRLQERLEKRPGPGQEISAIGVVGSDTYDKLLVLRALRRSFPRAVFFTTDLDASYLESNELDHTLNLVVATPFGLSAPHPYQGRIPPFRDSYQTAMFMTVLGALRVPLTLNQQEVPLAKFPPALFEVGRQGFVELPLTANAHEKSKAATPWLKVYGSFFLWTAVLLVAVLAAAVSLHFFAQEGKSHETQIKVGRHPLQMFAHFLLGFSFLLMLAIHITLLSCPEYAWGWKAAGGVLFFGYPFLLYYLVSVFELHAPEPGSKHALAPWLEPRRFVAIALLLLAVVIAIGGMVLQPVIDGGNEEPLQWFQGVSIWPTEVVRLVAMAASVYFVLHSQHRLRECREELAAKFGLSHASADACRMPAPSRWWRPPVHVYFWPFSRVAPECRDIPVWEDIPWTGYCRASTIRSRVCRVTLHVLLYLLFFSLFIYATGLPVVPARGPVSFAIDRGVLIASIFAYSYLLFFVLDATLLCGLLVLRLQEFIGEETTLHECETIHLINGLTEEVSKLVYFPFTVLFMLIAARNSLFDNWDWPVGLLGVFSWGLVLIIIVAALLQHAAQTARQKALDALNQALFSKYDQRAAAEAGKKKIPYRKRSAEWLEAQRAQIQALDGLVFQPWYNNPIFRAILIPLGGMGSVQLMQKAAEFLH